MGVVKFASVMVVTAATLEDQPYWFGSLVATLEEQRRLDVIGPFHGPPSPRDETRCWCSDGDCRRHADLTEDERAAVAALHASDIEVGDESGPFYAGQAEEVMLVLRRAGFTVTRVAAGSQP